MASLPIRDLLEQAEALHNEEQAKREEARLKRERERYRTTTNGATKKRNQRVKYHAKKLVEGLESAMENSDSNDAPFETPQEFVAPTLAIKRDGRAQKDNQEWKQKAQDRLVEQFGALRDDQKAIDAEVDAGVAKLQELHERQAKKEEEQVEAIFAAMMNCTPKKNFLLSPTGTPATSGDSTPLIGKASTNKGLSPIAEDLQSRLNEVKAKSECPKIVRPRLHDLYMAPDVKLVSGKQPHLHAPVLIKEGIEALDGLVQIGDCAVLLSNGELTLHATKQASWISRMFFSSAPTTPAKMKRMEMDGNIDRIAAGPKHLVAFCGDVAH
eukprot:scaffold9105_cov151-Amphora_coffeaeformis.AAC.5